MIKKTIMRKPSEVGWGNILAGLIAGAAGLAFGFLLFIQPARDNQAALEEKVTKLEKSANTKKSPSESSKEIKVSKPSQEVMTAEIEQIAAQSGLEIKDIDFVGLRAEVVTESEPLTVAKFASLLSEQIKTKPSIQTEGASAFPVSANGEALPQSVIVIESLYNLAQ